MALSNIEKLTTSQFMAIGNDMFGENRWGQKMAALTGMSQPSVSNAMRGVSISKKTTQMVIDTYTAFLANNGLDTEMSSVAVEPTKPAFVDLPMVRDTANGRMIPASSVNPDLIGAAKDARSDELILSTIRKRFDITDRAVQGIIGGHIKSMIVF